MILYVKSKAPLLFFTFSLFAVIIFAAFTRSEPDKWTPEILANPRIAEKYYLPDFSYAGYHWGEKGLPEFAATLQVTNFGAVPDDEKDDTDAIRKALAQSKNIAGTVVLKFPEGKFIVTQILFIDRSHFVLQGSGSGENGTVLFMPQPMAKMAFPKELNELQEYLIEFDKRVKTGELYSPFAWMGGILWPRVPGKRIRPYLKKYDTPIQAITTLRSGTRGEHELVADAVEQLHVGELVRINWFNKDGKGSSFLQHLYPADSIKIGSQHWEDPQRPLITQDVTITAIAGNTISVKQPLLHDVRPEWHVTLSKEEFLQEIGIEHLRIEFPHEAYQGHHQEAGYNGIYLTDIVHSWVRDVKFVNADSPILSDNCSNVTIQDIEVSGRKGHYGIHLGSVYNLLAKKIKIEADEWHALSFNTDCKGSMFQNCEVAINPTLDQHCGANHQNLFDNIKLIQSEKAANIFEHGGADYWRPTHGAFNTLWNIQIDFTFENPASDTIMIGKILDGPQARLIGFHANFPIKLEYGPEPYLEGINQSNLAVPSLYDYQLKRRLSTNGNISH